MNRWLIKLSTYVGGVLLVALLTVIIQSGLLNQWLAAAPSADVPAMVAIGATPKPDMLLAQSWWQDEVQYRVNITKNQQYNYCLFGDSITSALGNTLGDRTFNFALSGMSSVSQVEQLKRLAGAGVICNQVIMAIGTNDADYSITNDQFITNMRTVIALCRKMQAFRIILLPAFYSTVAASQNIALAGPIERVEQINTLLRQVAATEQVAIGDLGFQPLYNGQALRDNLTMDGVHLNAQGRVIYRTALLRLINTPPF